jgi:acyl-CoA dehydrogenase
MVVTDADAPVHRRTSMLIVPAGTPGLDIVRNVGYGDHADTHAYLRFENCRVPADHMLAKQGEGFVVAQMRLGGSRIHHAMHTIAMARACLDAMTFGLPPWRARTGRP